MSTEYPILSEAQWQLLDPLLMLPGSRHRSSTDERRILLDIIIKFATHCPWYDIPSVDSSWQTCYHRYRLWTRTGVWKSIVNTLLRDLYTRGEPEVQAALDNREIKYSRDGSGRFSFEFPPSLNGTWQHSTILMLFTLLAIDYESSGRSSLLPPLRPSQLLARILALNDIAAAPANPAGGKNIQG